MFCISQNHDVILKVHEKRNQFLVFPIREHVNHGNSELMSNAVKSSFLGMAVDLESFRMLAEAIPNLAWIAHPDGSNFWYNKRWWDYTGTVPQELEGWGWTIVHDPKVLPQVLETWKECVEKGLPFEMELPLRGSDGNFRWFLARVMPVRDSNQQIINWFGTATDIHAQKRAIEKADQAEKKLARFLSSIPMILWATDKNGIVTLSEGKGLASLGLTPGQTVGWDMLNAPEVAQESVQWVKRALLGESFEVITHFDGRIVESHYEPLLDEKGRPDGMVAIANDVTEQKKLEASLQKSQQTAKDLARRLQAVLKNAPIALSEINSEGVYTFSDGLYLSKVGMKPGELVGQSCFDPQLDCPERMEVLRRSFAGETITTEVRNGDNWVLSSTMPMEGEDGRIQSIVALVVDVTAQKNAEKSNLTSETKFRKVCESKLFGMLFWDKTGAITNTNDSFLEMIGYSREELSSGALDWKKLTPLEYAEMDANAVQETIVHGHCEPYEKEFVRKDGSRVPVIISGATIQDDAEAGGIALILDISSKKKAEEEKALSILSERAALEASEAKSQFLANMSHEIRTPINGVMGLSTLLLESVKTPEQKEYAENILRCAETLLTLVNDILDLSKAEAGKIDLELIDFDVEEILVDVERTLSFAAEKKGLSFKRSIKQGTPNRLQGDPTRLRQVLMNLVNNAIKFTPEGDISVEVDCESIQESEVSLRMRVTDTGIGIPAEALHRMFKAFSQADASTTRKFGGTGLGLSICKHLVTLMGGEIGVENGEDKGSTFWFKVPLKKSLKSETSVQIAPPAKMAVQRLRILLAEDNSVNQLIATKMLQKIGHTVVAAANGNEVIDALRTAPYDLILMDCQMPEMDGYEATKIIRTSQTLGCHKIPIIAMTANAMSGDREKCLAVGMDAYVSKPIKIDILQKEIESTMKLKV